VPSARAIDSGSIRVPPIPQLFPIIDYPDAMACHKLYRRAAIVSANGRGFINNAILGWAKVKWSSAS